MAHRNGGSLSSIRNITRNTGLGAGLQRIIWQRWQTPNKILNVLSLYLIKTPPPLTPHFSILESNLPGFSSFSPPTEEMTKCPFFIGSRPLANKASGHYVCGICNITRILKILTLTKKRRTILTLIGRRIETM